MSKRKISWTKIAADQFNTAIDHIRQDSDQNADKVKQKLLEKISQLADRFVYFVAGPKQVFIIRIRHTSREPQKY